MMQYRVPRQIASTLTSPWRGTTVMLAVVLLTVLGACFSDPGPVPPPVAGMVPAVLFMDVTAGPNIGGPDNLGVPITIFGKGFGASRGSASVTIGGTEVARYLIWGQNNARNPHLDMIVVQPGPDVTGGPVIVRVNGRSSNADQVFTVNTGKVYAIAKNGADSNPCSLESPCATVLHVAGSLMKPGDTVLVRGGDYLESEIWIRGDQNQSGTEANPKVIRNYPGENVIFSNAARPFIVDADFITVSGLQFKNGKALSIAAWANRNQRSAWLINNAFQGVIAWDAIGSHGNDHLMAGNVCEVSGSTVGTQGHCYYVSYGNNVKVIYNIASGAPGYGLHVFDQQRSTPDFKRVISNLLIEGNILKNSTQRSGLIIAMNDEGGYGNQAENIIVRNNVLTTNNHNGMQIQANARNVKIYNNTLYQNGVGGIYVGSGVSTVEVRNNLIHQSPSANCKLNCEWFAASHVQNVAGAGATVLGNVYLGTPMTLQGTSDAQPIAGTANFVDPAALNFRLLVGSGVIDRASDAGATVPRDADGQSRPQGAGFEPGAFEFISK